MNTTTYHNCDLIPEVKSQPVAIPEKYVIDALDGKEAALYKRGWNDCVDLMLTMNSSKEIK